MVSDGVIKKMLYAKKKCNVFDWMPTPNDIEEAKDAAKAKEGGGAKWSGVFSLNAGPGFGHDVVWAYHFSAAGARRRAFVHEMRKMIDDHCPGK